MIYSIAHTTTYAYSRAVFLEPHTLRFHPRPDPAQQVLRHALRITPEPAGLSTGLDVWGNTFGLAWFNGLHAELSVRSTCEMRTQRHNPFDYLLPARAMRLPMRLEVHESAALQACLARRHPPSDGLEDPVRKLTLTLLRETNHSSNVFLVALNQWIFEHVARSERLEPGILEPAYLLEQRRGSCRDLAELFLEACREAGVAARFVSGYQEGDPDKHEAELHAWAEVYLPGAGWRGYDPTYGLTVADRHIALAAAPDPEQTMPLTGTFRGTGATSAIAHEVSMSLLD